MTITINCKEFCDLEEFMKHGRGCATTRPNHYQIQRNDERISSSRMDSRPGRVEIPIRFVHVTDGELGRISIDQRQRQVEVLNNAYSSNGIEFRYDESDVEFVDNPRWYRMDHGSPEERAVKTAHQAQPREFLNFYTGGIARGLLGWATFPWELDGDPVRDGVVLLDESLPGGTAAPFNLGQTATHEVGHWLGLYHTFQGGCNAFGDHVDDTPAHSGPNVGKPEVGLPHNACSPDQFAPVNNFMNYVDDEWMQEFTPLQNERMWYHLQVYRETLITNSDS